MVSSLTEFASKLRSEKVLPFVQTEGTLREVHDAITEMMKQLANEPSVGLYFVQQHVHKAVPGMVSLKAQMVENTREVEYVTQDVKDALNSVRSMKEVGTPVIERMIKTLDASLPLLASSLRQSKRVSSAQDPLEKDSSRQATSSAAAAGDYSGYVRTTFDSAFQKASSSMANISKWNSYSKTPNSESSSSIGGNEADLRASTNSEAAHAESNHPNLNAQTLVGTLEKTASEPSTGTSTSKDKIFAAKDQQEDSSDPSLGKIHSLPAFGDFSDHYGKPGQYMRSVLGSARQTAESVSREATRFLSDDGRKPESANDQPAAQGWGWFHAPSKALGRAFSKSTLNPQTSQQDTTTAAAQAASGRGRLIVEEASSSGRSEEETQRLLDLEIASNEAFVAEKAAELERWLQGTEEGDKDTGLLA